ncbi:glycosyltransferase family 4 protein [Mucilaginibacter sp. HMF5004]|uniref:glycosyltransferase family 4 protein n=1 Tax=Mucilaginibacter rivuli TaxID=2857527 RepID=UPI001C5D43F6|nr:glycosyltransferase family 4 protein [Mucilaginibacter rivuli]MBW4890071.1 glycosyltransferase family 4 protein [Mucilaginibacter rivuli]
MRICHVIANLYAGGAQTFVVLLAIEQKKAGNDVYIVLIDKFNHSQFETFLTTQLTENNIPVFTLERKPGKNFSIFKSFILLGRIIKSISPDIINTHLQFTHLIVALYLKVFKLGMVKAKYIATIHNAPEEWNKQTLLTNKHTPSIYCSQASLQTSVVRNCPKVVIENGIKLPVVNNSANKIIEDYKVNPAHKLVLMVGKLSHQKNYPLAVAIAKHYEGKDISFLICGILEETADQDLISFKTVNNIHYLGIKVPAEIYSLMDRCDCFLNTSHYEGLPITVLEAFFIGTPCVLSPILPHREIGTEMPGCYIPGSFDKEAFIEKIDEALAANASKAEMREFRKPALNKYRIYEVAAKYVTFYSSVLNN